MAKTKKAAARKNATKTTANRKATGKNPEKAATRGSTTRTSKKTPRTTPKDAPLSKSQALVLDTLSKSKTAMTRGELSEHTGITTGFCNMLGQKDETRRHPRSLWARGLVTVAELDTGQLTYKINAAGRKALKSAEPKN